MSNKLPEWILDFIHTELERTRSTMKKGAQRFPSGLCFGLCGKVTGGLQQEFLPTEEPL